MPKDKSEAGHILFLRILNPIHIQAPKKDIISYPYPGPKKVYGYTMCPADNATAGSLGRRRAGQLRFGFVAVLKGHIVYPISFVKNFASIVTVSEQQNARPGSTAEHKSSTFYGIELKP
jgi:hypothetical protein